MDSNPSPSGRDAGILRCSACGAPVPPTGPACAHCGGLLDAALRSLGPPCDGCGTRVSTAARFCHRCGRACPGSPPAAATTARNCPRCRAPLLARAVGRDPAAVRAEECGRCGGLWFAAAELDAICARIEREGGTLLAALAPAGAPALLPPETKVVYLPCPVCGDLMTRRQFAERSRVVIDLCRADGTWLDRDELAAILAFVRRGGLEEQRRRQLDELARERAAARAAPGVWTQPLGGLTDPGDATGVDVAGVLLRTVAAAFRALRR